MSGPLVPKAKAAATNPDEADTMALPPSGVVGRSSTGLGVEEHDQPMMGPN